jgi:putative ABC transport system permease protein
MKSGVIDLSILQIGFAMLLLCMAGLLSVFMQLGLERRIVWGALRMVLQLSAAGLLLKVVFELREPVAVAGLVLMMTLIAGHAASQRSRFRYPRMFLDAFIAMTLGSWSVGIFLLLVVVQATLLGMILGNSLDGVALGLDRMTDTLRRDRHLVEMKLSLGATRWEAVRSIVQEAVRTGITPVLNSMTVIGLVSIPGMMTGQILAGADPVVAVKYQIVIMVVIASAVSIGTMSVCFLGYRRIFNKFHQFNPRMLQP